MITHSQRRLQKRQRLQLQLEVNIQAKLRLRREIEVSVAAHDDAGVAVDVRVGLHLCTDIDGSLEVSVGLAVKVEASIGVEGSVELEVSVEVGEVGVSLAVKVEASFGVEGSVESRARTGADAHITSAAEGRVCLEGIPLAKVQSSSEVAVGSDNEAVALADFQGAWHAAEALGNEAGAGAA